MSMWYNEGLFEGAPPLWSPKNETLISFKGILHDLIWEHERVQYNQLGTVASMLTSGNTSIQLALSKFKMNKSIYYRPH